MRILCALAMLLAAIVAAAADITPVEKVERYVNIRSGPDAGAEVVGRLDRGQTLPSLGVIDGWYRVELPDGGEGYVHGDWAVVVATEPGEPGDSETAAESVADTADVETVDDGATDSDAVETAVSTAPEPPAEPVPDVEPADAAAVPQPAPAESVVEPTPESAVSAIEGRRDFLVRFRTATTGTTSQIYDDGNVVGIGTTAPQQRLEVNGSIQVNDQHSSVAGLMITQSSGDTGYILHNRASTLTIGAGSVDRMTIDRAGNVGIGIARPEHPLHLANGAYLSAGGVWTNSSSRAAKENIATISPESAAAAVMALVPVSFRYRTDNDETHLGFIAEDVPDLVATQDRSGLSAMDIVAALTRVVQEQEKRIALLEEKLADVRN